MFKLAVRTLWAGLLPLGLAACTLQLPETVGQAGGQPAPELPPKMDFFIPTGDNADRVRVVSQPTAGVGDRVSLCLELSGITWWKGLGVDQTEPTLEVQDNNKVRCTNVAPSQVSLTFWKAKTFGAHTRIGGAALNLRGYGGHKVTLLWSAD